MVTTITLSKKRLQMTLAQTDSTLGEVEFYDQSGTRRTISIVAVIPDIPEKTKNPFAIDENLLGLFDPLINYS